MPLTTSKVEATLKAIDGRKEYYLKKRQSVKDGTYDAEQDPEAQTKKSAPANGVASTSNGPTANGDASEDFEHVSSAACCIPMSIHLQLTMWLLVLLAVIVCGEWCVGQMLLCCH